MVESVGGRVLYVVSTTFGDLYLDLVSLILNGVLKDSGDNVKSPITN